MATAAELVLAGADVAALSKVVELALFYDASSCSHENANEVRPCQDTYWVCETHDDHPWSGEKACGCGGAGMPCPSCNVSNPDNPPRLPAAFSGTRA
jgi:hypothetical protein